MRAIAALLRPRTPRCRRFLTLAVILLVFVVLLAQLPARPPTLAPIRDGEANARTQFDRFLRDIYQKSQEERRDMAGESGDEAKNEEKGDSQESTSLFGAAFRPAAAGVSKTIKEAHYDPIEVAAYAGSHELEDESKNYFLDLSCKDIEYLPSVDEDPRRVIEHSATKMLPDDFQNVNEYLRKTGYGALIAKDGQDLETFDFVALPDWYRFTGSAVWLPDHKVHLMASRLVYSPNKIPILSLVRLQLYDADWHEIQGRRIRYIDVPDQELLEVMARYGGRHKDDLLDSVSIKFPAILDIALGEDTRKDLLGPEDPRITYNDVALMHEPVVVYNQDVRGRRTMFATFPLRRTEPGHKKEVLLLRTSLMGSFPFEKNWTPFFDKLAPAPPKGSKGSMYMFYGLDPLKVFRCSLDTGECDVLQNSHKKTTLERESLTSVRGATTLKAVPRRVVQRLLRRDGVFDPNYPLQMWVGFAKTHIDDCGCGHMMYRPVLMVLVKQDNSFRVDVLTDSIDFHKDVMAWNDHSSVYCDDGNSVMNPNDISFWSIGEEEAADVSMFSPGNDKLPYYEDYMALTLSEADENVQVIFLKNIMNYVMGSYEHNRLVLGAQDVFGGIEERTKKVETCMLEAGIRYCEKYSKSHKRPVSEKDEAKPDAE